MEKKQTKLPDIKEVKESLHDPSALIALGDLAIEHILENRSKYDQKWFENLYIALGNLKDAVELKTKTNSELAKLALLLFKPVRAPIHLTKAEISDLEEEPTEKDIEAWAWGIDLTKTSKWFLVFVLLGILSILSFAVVTFGLESPGNLPNIIFLSIGSGLLASATIVLGIGLYRHYVLSGYIYWKGYLDANIKRTKNFYREWGWYAYSLGGIFLASGVGLAIVFQKQTFNSNMLDYYVIRQAFLGSIALGLIFFSFGVWPIVRSVVFTAEKERRIGKTKYMTSPRLILVLLPIITGTLSFLINWLFG